MQFKYNIVQWLQDSQRHRYHCQPLLVTYQRYIESLADNALHTSGGIFHDPDVYENPEWFWPDRFLDNDVGTKKEKGEVPGQRNDIAFGGGRVSIRAGME